MKKTALVMNEVVILLSLNNGLYGQDLYYLSRLSLFFLDRSGRTRHLGSDMYTPDAEGYLNWEILLP